MDSIDSVSTRFAGPLKLLGALAGAIVGLAALLFYSGFTAQRAQFELAGIPVAFIDYWAYVEIGVTAFIRSCILALDRPTLLILLFAFSLSLVLLREWRLSQRVWAKADLLFLVSLVHLALIAALIVQQLQVSRLTRAESGPPSAADGTTTLKTDIIPATIPFKWVIPPGYPVPEELPSSFGDADSAAIFRALAADLENSVVQRQYLPLRPSYPWERPATGDPAALSFFQPVATEGNSSAEYGTSEERASRLYSSMILWLTACLWLWILLFVWAKHLQNLLPKDRSGRVLMTPPPDLPDNRARNRRRQRGDNGREEEEPAEKGKPARRSPRALWAALIGRLREELWWATQRVVLPVSALSLFLSIVILMPECYGILEMKHIGHEMVEVVTKTRASESGAKKAPLPPSPGGGKPLVDADLNSDLKRKLSQHADTYILSEPEDQLEQRDKWREEIGRIAALKTSRSLEFLVALADMTRPYASELASDAQSAADEFRSEVASVHRGYILYYPRSTEEKFVRLLSKTGFKGDEHWQIIPVPLVDVIEVRIVKDTRTANMISALKRMGDLDPEQRKQLIVDLEVEGHEALAELELAALFDPDPDICSIACTSVARYAQALDDETCLGQQRRDRVVQVLMQRLGDPECHLDTRGAAATALHYVCKPRHFDKAGELILGFLTGPERAKADPTWDVSGGMITALGRLRHAKAVPALIGIFQDEKVPPFIRAVIPNALATIDERTLSTPALLAALRERDRYPEYLVGPSIVALSSLGKGDGRVLEALVEFIKSAPTDPRWKNRPEKLDTFLGAALTAIHSSHHRNGAEIFREILGKRRNYQSLPDQGILLVAARALGRGSYSAAEPELLQTCLDEDLHDRVRLAAIESLGSYKLESTLEELWKLYASPGTSLKFKLAIKDTMYVRLDRGSGPARRYYALIIEDLRSYLDQEPSHVGDPRPSGPELPVEAEEKLAPLPPVPGE